MVRALSVWADAPQFETTCVVRLVRHPGKNGTKWFKCGLGTGAESELNVNKTLNDKFDLASLEWPVARKV